MATPHEPRTPHYPEDPDLMQTRLIEEIVQLQAQLGLDLLGPRSAIALRAASTEALGLGEYDVCGILDVPDNPPWRRSC
jgi:hypothetical protein